MSDIPEMTPSDRTAPNPLLEIMHTLGRLENMANRHQNHLEGIMTQLKDLHHVPEALAEHTAQIKAIQSEIVLRKERRWMGKGAWWGITALLGLLTGTAALLKVLLGR